jgi:hypothetical protein
MSGFTTKITAHDAGGVSDEDDQVQEAGKPKDLVIRT